MPKTITLTIVKCKECPYFQCNALWFAHCKHPSLLNLSWDKRRISKPRETDLNIPCWCPLKEK